MNLFSPALSFIQTYARINNNRVNCFATNHHLKLSLLVMSSISMSIFGTVNVTAVSRTEANLNTTRSTWSSHVSANPHIEKVAIQSSSYENLVLPTIDEIQENFRLEDLYQYNYTGKFNMSFISDLRNKSSLQYRNVSKIIKDKVSF